MKKFLIPIIMIVVGIVGIIINTRFISYERPTSQLVDILQISFFVLVLFGLAFLGTLFIKRLSIPIITIVLGIACFFAFSIIGSEVDSDGILREPFFLVPIGYLFLFLGMAWLGNVLIKKQLIPLSLIVVGIVCLIVFKITAEPFALRSIGSSLILLAGFWSISVAIKKVQRISHMDSK